MSALSEELTPVVDDYFLAQFQPDALAFAVRRMKTRSRTRIGLRGLVLTQGGRASAATFDKIARQLRDAMARPRLVS